MNIVKAKKEIYDFLREEMNVNNKYIDKSESDVWIVYVKF